MVKQMNFQIFIFTTQGPIMKSLFLLNLARRIFCSKPPLCCQQDVKTGLMEPGFFMAGPLPAEWLTDAQATPQRKPRLEISPALTFCFELVCSMASRKLRCA